MPHPPPRRPSSLDGLRARLRRATAVQERARLDVTLVNLLIIAFAGMALVGAFEAWGTSSPAALVQPVVALALLGWALWSKHRRRPQPIPLLLVAATAATAFIVVSAVFGSVGDTARTSPLVIIFTSGAFALLAGGRRPVWIGIYVTVLAVVLATAVSVRIGLGTVEAIAEVLSTVIILTIAYYMVRSVWEAYESGSSRLSGLMEAAPVAVLEVDLTNYVKPGSRPVQLIREMNPRAFKLLAIRPGEAATVTLADIHPAAMGVLDQVVTSPALAGETMVEIEDRWLLVSWKAVSRRFDRVLFSGVDVTAQRQAEAALIEQVEGRDRFIATVSHELRTPLTGVLGLLELVASGEVAEEETGEFLRMALSQTRDMADIVQDLLVAARAANGALAINPEPTDLEAIVEGVMAAFDEPFAIEIAGSIGAIADPVRVRQIIRNLATNAIRYGGDERRLVVTADRVRAAIEVRDSGPELSPEFQHKMFEPYERSGVTELPTESVGLGLTVARTLAHLMGGDLTYHHTGRESVFTLSLPRATDSHVA